jgi:acid stress-induced BolA-like protein IbaG/YrbA
VVTPEQIKQLIESGLPGAEARVAGEDGTHFEALVISPDFAGKNVVAQHRMVYAALGSRMGTEIHALALKTLTPEQWASRSSGH